MDELFNNLVKQSDEEIMKYITERQNLVHPIGQPARGLLEPWMELELNEFVKDNVYYTCILNEFNVLNRNGRVYNEYEYDPFISGQPVFILQPPKFLSDLLADFLNDTKQLSFYRLQRTKELLKEVPTIHINGGAQNAIEVSKNKYEQTQRSRKNGVSSYGCSRPFWS